MEIPNWLKSDLERLTFDAEELDRRLKAPLSRAEMYALAIGLGYIIGLTVLANKGDGLPYDYHVYISASQGDFEGFFYPYWALPIFTIFATLPKYLAFFLWNLITGICFWWGARIFSGDGKRLLLIIIGYQFLVGFLSGQIFGLLTFGLALFWWSAAKKRWGLAGLGLVVSSIKPQSYFFFALILWALANINWQERLRTLGVPVAVAILSIFIWPNWPLDVLQASQTEQLFTEHSIALQPQIGWWSLLFILPPLVMKLDWRSRLIALWAAVPLVVPYFNRSDLATLFFAPISYIFILIGNLGYLTLKFGDEFQHNLWVIPMAIYLVTLWQGYQKSSDKV